MSNVVTFPPVDTDDGPHLHGKFFCLACTLFWLTRKGAMCRQCGTRSNDWAN